MSRARDFADLASSADAGGITGKNLIINGGQSISQRGTSISITSDSVYGVDRFITRTYGGNGTYTVSTLQTDIPTVGDFYYSTKYAVNSAATDTGTYGYSIEQRIEGYNASHLRLGRADAKRITLSFWVKSSVAGTYTGAIRTTAAEYSYVFEYTLSANTWTKVEKTISALTGVTLSLLDETNGIALYVSPINFGAQTSKSTATTDTWLSGNYAFSSNQVDWMGTAGATCYITGVQLEVGEQATPFEHRSYGDELARCQRYYQKSYSDGDTGGTVTNNGALWTNIIRDASNQNYWDVRCYQVMRSSPTVLTYSTTSGVSGNYRNVTDSTTNASAVSNTSSSGFSIRPDSGTNQNIGDVIAVHWVADAEL